MPVGCLGSGASANQTVNKMAAPMRRTGLFCMLAFQNVMGRTFFRNLRSFRQTREGTKILSNLSANNKIEWTTSDDFIAPSQVQEDTEFHQKQKHFPCLKFPRDSEQNVNQKDESDVQFNKSITSENPYQLLASKVTPLYEIPYEDQLKVKRSRCKRILKDIGKVLRKSAKVHVGSDLLPCALESVIPSPVTDKYRNQDEFSIRPGIDGNPKTVGLFLDSVSANPNTLCVGTDEIVIIRDSHKALAKDFENYIRQSSLDACINFSENGHWRNIIVRSNMKDELMAIVVMHPQQLSVEQKEKEKEKLKEYFLSLKPKKYDLKSLYFRECYHTKGSSTESPFQLLFGNEHLFEKLNNLNFRISPESFFQTNTLAAECLMKVIFNLCQASENSVVMDIFCGTGPVSLTFAPYVKKCIGIDVFPQVIEDARTSAKINGIENVEFCVGKIESLIPHIMDKTYGEEFIAIVNPSRSCLGKSAVHALRCCKYLSKVLYVSRNPNAALQNFTDLCRPAGKDSHLGKPFYPMISVPVDMFPHTNHCELAVLFQRI